VYFVQKLQGPKTVATDSTKTAAPADTTKH
jgi:hypothetical protein